MPQGDLMVIPLTSTIGYQANTHILVHLTDGNPDMGRKVFQPETKALGDELARRVVDVFKRYLSLMREDTGVFQHSILARFMGIQEATGRPSFESPATVSKRKSQAFDYVGAAE
jgi:hypothetical protein